MSDNTPILQLPLIQPSQAQKHVTHNEALRLLDTLVQPAVLIRGVDTPPAAPAPGDRYILGNTPMADWAGHPGEIAVYEETGWMFLTPMPGWTMHIVAEGRVAWFEGGAWVTAADRPLRVAALGVSADPDASNRMVVAGAATLFDNVGAGHQVKLNKAATGDTASFLFQTGYSGRAEIGTVGSSDFSVKVSANGASFVEGLRIGAPDGILRAPQGLALPDGSAALPSLAFSAGPDTGLSRPAAGTLGLSAGGALRLTAASAGLTATVPFVGTDGTGTAPAFSFSADTDTGVWRIGANILGIAAGGGERLRVTTAGVQVTGILSGTAITQSQTDATVGRVTKVADFGLGATTGSLSSQVLADLDSFTIPQGFYSANNTTTAGTLPPINTTADAVIVLRPAGNQTTQIYSVPNNNATYLRKSFSSTSWGPWRLIYDWGSVIGTVSQSGGAPTGALSERGTSANGVWRRAADGEQRCWRQNLSATNATTAVGSLFRSADISWTFPASFDTTLTPVVLADTDDADSWAVVTAVSATTATLRVVSALSKSTAITVRAMAIGRWAAI